MVCIHCWDLDIYDSYPNFSKNIAQHTVGSNIALVQNLKYGVRGQISTFVNSSKGGSQGTPINYNRGQPPPHREKIMN